MRMSDAFPSNYVKAQDLQGRTVTATIADCRMEDFGGEEKPVLYFQGKEKGLVLNKTNASAIVSAYGDETTAWAGRPVELFVARVMFQGRMVDGIRVRVPAPAAPEPAPAPHASGEPFNDDIPF